MHLAEHLYYIICLNFKFRKLYIIWISDEIDTVATNSNNRIIAFKTKGELLIYAHKNAIVFDEDLTIYNIDDVQQWIISPCDKFDREKFLNFWNLCTDISESINIKFSGDIKDESRNRIYDKLFDANGVFIAENPDPVFGKKEILKLSEIMQNGLALLLNNLSVIDDI